MIILPDDHGLSSIPGAHVWTARSRESDDIISPKAIDLASWKEILEHSTRQFHSTIPSNVSSSSSQPASMGVVLEEENMTLGGLLASGSVVTEEFQNFVPIQSNWQVMTLQSSICTIGMSTSISHSTLEKVDFLLLFSCPKDYYSIFLPKKVSNLRIR